MSHDTRRISQNRKPTGQPQERRETTFQQRKSIVKYAYTANDSFVDSLSFGSKRTKNSIGFVLNGELNDTNAAFEMMDLIVSNIEMESNENVLCTIVINK